MRGKRISWKTLFTEKQGYNRIIPKIQICKREDESETLQVFMPLTEINLKFNAVSYEPSYGGIRALIEGIMEIYGKAEVEKELNIKIGGEKKE